MQLFIGEESGYRVLDECSVVTAPYYVDGEVAGVLGVIGPTRMAYHRIIPLVSRNRPALVEGLESRVAEPHSWGQARCTAECLIFAPAIGPAEHP